MTEDPSSTGPAGAQQPAPPWEITLAGDDGESAAEEPSDLPRRKDGLARHRAGEVGEEFAPRADWRLNAWLAGAVAGVLAIVLGTGWLVQGLPARPAPAPEAAPPPPAATTGGEEARNVVFVLTDGGGATVAAALMGADSRRATCLLTPRRLVLDVRGSGPTPLSSAFAASEATAETAVEDTLGVRVDGTWQLSTKGLAALVEDVGGVRVDTGAKVGPDGAVVDGGEVKALAGEEAAEYAVRAPRGADENQRLARFYAVLDGVLHALPDDERKRGETFARLGGETRSTLPRRQFLSFVGDLHRHVRSEDMADTVLPVVRAAPDRPAGYDLDAVKFRVLLEGPLANVRRPVRVRVEADGETSKSADAVRSRLEAARLAIDPAPATDADAAASEKGPERTTITVARSPSALVRAREVARALGLPASVIELGELEDVAYDVLVQLGEDLEGLLRRAGATPAPSAS